MLDVQILSEAVYNCRIPPAPWHLLTTKHNVYRQHSLQLNVNYT